MKLERNRRKGELVMELTPLIDVVFLLLIFFLVATTFDEMRGGIKIDLPNSTINEVASVKELQIVVNKNKSIILNYKENGKLHKENLDINSLRHALARKLKETKDKNVIISADKNVDYGYIVDIMTISKETGAKSLDIDTQIRR